MAILPLLVATHKVVFICAPQAGNAEVMRQLSESQAAYQQGAAQRGPAAGAWPAGCQGSTGQVAAVSAPAVAGGGGQQGQPAHMHGRSQSLCGDQPALQALTPQQWQQQQQLQMQQRRLQVCMLWSPT
jgi:hypothetical protein